MKMNSMNRNTMNQETTNQPWDKLDTFSPEAMEMMRLLLDAIDEQRYHRREAEKQLEAQKGKVQFADAVSGCEDSIKVHEMAAILFQSGIDIGEYRLYQWLRDNGYVYRQGCGQNMPSQKSLEMGVMELQKYLVERAGGRQSVIKVPMITPKGKEYFMQVLSSRKEQINAAEAAKQKENTRQRDARYRQKKKQQSA